MAITHNFKPTISISPSSRYTPSVPSRPFPLKTHTGFHFFSPIPSRFLFYQAPSLSLSRRLFLPSVSGIWDALTGGNNARESVIAVRRGMLLFRQGDVSGSLAEFDKAIELDPRQKAYLWQRGLSLYYLDRFEEGAEQFRLDVAQNPNDTEESIWCFLCEAQLYGVDEARQRFLEAKLILLVLVGRDSRPVMRKAYNMFKDGGDPEKVHDHLRFPVLAAEFSSGQANECFYSSLYAGLYYESQADLVFLDPSAVFATTDCQFSPMQKKPDDAKLHVVAACQSPYGQRSDDYMASLAKVHCLCRNWGSI
ncbi:hypothetical protein FEM48_Zijuj02G0135200 [Ziziphus jujuba var. spinosa]|uniref:Uncharacterized protein n=1 Tax=Ziziphus jujuba var. spinosa TaxID=714518 RepID=A0A978VW02_ZIZJJ|nr:hypothetical protein FEM48_Zijuj02G0135200 [Ziziphus jujuba var. spinosa]